MALSYRLLAEGSTPSHVETVQCGICAEVVELIHAGSLVVDDIEDGSTIRRGKPALHIRYGLPTALNAGNWLYFWPFQLIKALELPNRTALSVYECYHRTLLRAHFGQAMDLGSRVDRLLQTRVPDVCLATMELKTGALMGFAMMLGAATARACWRRRLPWWMNLGVISESRCKCLTTWVMCWAFASPPRSMRTSCYIGLRGPGGAPQERATPQNYETVCGRGGQVAGRSRTGELD